MSLLGIDVGTSGCKATALSAEGKILATAYREYDVLRPRPGRAELDSREVWGKVQDVIAEVAAHTRHDPIAALCVSSMGEAMTPVSAEREILGNCLMGFDARGAEAVARLSTMDPIRFFEISGNVASNIYGGPKLAWLRDNHPRLFARAHKFLGWQGLVVHLLGCDAVMDYSLANRTLFLDLQAETWSAEVLDLVGIPAEKLPRLVPTGTVAGTVADAMADRLGLPRGVKVVVGAHDQCVNAVGAGVTRPGMAAYGLGTFICITPTFDAIPPAALMVPNKLNVEHHALPGLYVSFYSNLTGGALLKWFRDTFAQAEKTAAQARGMDVYDLLLAEMPPEPTDLMVLPHFAPTGPPYFEESARGLIAGLTLETTRGEFIKALLEGVTYYFRAGLDILAQANIAIDEYRATGGGAKSDGWLQIKADILGRPLARPRVTEATSLGAVILAGVGAGVYASVDEAIRQLVQIERVFEPDPKRHAEYTERFARYARLYPFVRALYGDE
jgi:xylulokinase